MGRNRGERERNKREEDRRERDGGERVENGLLGGESGSE